MKKLDSDNLLGESGLARVAGGLDDCAGGRLGRSVQECQIGHPDSQGNQEQAGRYDGPGKEPFIFICAGKSYHDGLIYTKMNKSAINL